MTRSTRARLISSVAFLLTVLALPVQASPDEPAPGGTLRGRVVDTHGQPVASGWCVRTEVWEAHKDAPPGNWPGMSGSHRSFTAEGTPGGDGTFRWDDVPAGRYGLSVSAVEPSASTFEGRHVLWEVNAATAVVEAAGEEVVEIVFPRAIRIIIDVAPGTERAPTLQPPLESVWLLGPLPDGVTAADVLDGGSLREGSIFQGMGRVMRRPFQYRPSGDHPDLWLDDRYEVVDPSDGRYVAVLCAPGYATTRSAELTVGETAALRTQGTCALTLRAVDESTGAPVEGITLSECRVSRHGPPGYWMGPTASWQRPHKVSDSSVAEFTDLVPGEWSITISAPDYLPTASAPVMLEPCDGPRELVVRLRRGG